MENNIVKEQIIRSRQEARDNWYTNPQKPLHHIAKTAIQVLDPTGISSYSDLSDAIDLYKANKSTSNAFNVLINGISAIPILGKVGKGLKLFKGIRNIEKLGSILGNINKTIDTVPELIPGIRQVTSKIQDITSILPNKYLPKNYYSRTKYNTAIDVTNGINSTSDILGNMSPIFLPEFKTSPRLITGTEKKKEEK